ncbi:hypothetical protein BV898_12630 [Hypsibius exemplaris]|uniref:Uncharacterized protein n=1 Tax=Hypsibius exemplaris TaxID=2072580 RepID=A0A1W0WD35_HYPEX|nr:hypothetical protein BV898_12630 [Hypsibius exemplaris]
MAPRKAKKKAPDFASTSIAASEDGEMSTSTVDSIPLSTFTKRTRNAAREASVALNKSFASVPEEKAPLIPDFLEKLLENPNFEITGPELAVWVTDTATNKQRLEQYEAFWDTEQVPSRLDTAEDLCERLEKFLLSFIADPASWEKDKVEFTVKRMLAVLKLFKPIINTYPQPPKSIFRRLEALQKNIFRIQPYAKYSAASIASLLEAIVDSCELWFLKVRPDGYKLMGYCVIFLLAKEKLTIPMLKRLNSWSDYFLLFRAPVAVPDEIDVGIRSLFPDLEPEEWEDDERSNPAPKGTLQALMTLEKTDYLGDAVLKLFCRHEVISTPEGRKLLTLLLTVNQDFINIGRLAIHDVMDTVQNLKLLEALSDVVLKAWTDMQKKSLPLRYDLEAIIILDLMLRSIRTDPNYKNKFLSKYCLMVSHMYNCTDGAIRRMFHSNYDLRVLDAVVSPNVTIRGNALRMLGKCFPLIGPEVAKKEHPALMTQQLDIILLNMKHACPDFRAAAACAAGEALHRAWALVKIPERTELLKQLSARLVCDDSSVAVRMAAVKAIGRILEQPLSLANMVPVMTVMKVMATDEAIVVRSEYYFCLLKAVALGMLTMEGGNGMLDTEQMLSNFVERDRPYVGIIGEILDQMVWNVDNLGLFLTNAVHLLLTRPAVAIKCFQTIPKTKSADEIHLVLDCIFGQICLALQKHERKVASPEDPLSMAKPDRMNAALELGGTIWAATVLILSQREDLHHKIQKKASAVLKRAISYTDVLDELHLYRLACHIPISEAPEYRDWCVDRLKATTPDKTEDGITLMTFLHNWGESEELLNIAKQWLEIDMKPKPPKRKRDDENIPPQAEKRAHLGLLYISMLVSDPDISGTFSDMNDKVMEYARQAVNAFVNFMPNRFMKKPRMDFQVDDRFYGNLLTFLAMLYIHHIHYGKDAGVIRDFFHKILCKVKEYVCDWVGLKAVNVMYAIRTYKKDYVKEILKKPESSPGAYTTVKLAAKIIESLQEILHQLAELNKLDEHDQELQIQLLGCTQAPTVVPKVVLLTPTETPRISPSRNRRGRR